MADTELNEVAKKAMDAYDDLMDLGMNVESRYSGRVFEVAGNMLKTSLDAKTQKLDKKLKIGVAGILPEGFVDQFETAMQKFQVVNMGAGKKTPIQERPLDFPQLQ